MTIRQMQDLLDYLDYTCDNDGYDGPKTRAAVEAFTRDYGVGTEALLDAVDGNVSKIPVSKSDTGEDGGIWDNSPYFNREEFRCTCRGRYCDGFPVEPAPKLVRILNDMRRDAGAPITITSGIRCAMRNADPDVGGVSDSQHILGTAADIQIKGMSPKNAAELAAKYLPNTGGIGVYDWGIHVDVRANASRWYG